MSGDHVHGGAYGSNQISDGSLFQRMSIFVSVAYLMPPPYLSFPEFPTKIDDASIENAERLLVRAHPLSARRYDHAGIRGLIYPPQAAL